MKQQKKTIWALSAALAVTALAGCEADVISSPSFPDSILGEDGNEGILDCLEDGSCSEEDFITNGEGEDGDGDNGDTGDSDGNHSTACEDKCTEGEKTCVERGSAVCERQESGCMDWSVTECGDGWSCDPELSECTEGCRETCDPNVPRRCQEDGVAICESDSAGCAVWNIEQSCEVGWHCDAEKLTCVEGCSEVCDPNALLKCTADGLLAECASDAAGCAQWTEESCTPGYYCDAEKAECVACAEVCDPAALKKCADGNVMTCSADARGCAVWTVSETCQSGSSCDAASLTCVEGCKNACTAGAKKCDGNGVSECKDTNGDGCTEWASPTACGTGKVCDDATQTCVNDCKDACTAGAKKCDGNGVAECKVSENGCTAWTNPVACGTGKMCNTKTNACEYTCGTECEPFSIVLLPDTQYYTRTGGSKKIYGEQTQWIVDNAKKENIKFVIHLGDITDHNYTDEWKIASAAHEKLDKAGIKYSISTGNHDYKGNESMSRSRSKFATYFNNDRMNKAFPNATSTWFSGYKWIANSYSTFQVGNIKFLVLALEYAPRKDVICWADEIIQKFPDHYVIVETHSYLTHNSATDSSKYAGGASSTYASHGLSGSEVYKELVSRHSNVILAVGGHVGDSEFRTKKGHNKNTVNEMLVDYQFEKKCSSGSCTDHCKGTEDSGNGWLRQLIFDPKTNTVQAKTLTVKSNSYFSGSKPKFYCSEITTTVVDGEKRNWYPSNKDDKVHQFSFACDFTSPIQYKYSTNNYLGFGTRDINSNGDGQQTVPSVAVNATTGAFVAVWEDDSSTADGTDNHDIAARLFYGGGCAKAKQFTVNADTAGHQSTPDIAMDKDGNFVVVWRDDTDGNGVGQIYMRGFDAAGKERFARKTVNSVDTGEQINPEIAMAPDGRFVVAWEDSSLGKKQIFVRGFDANGKQRFADKNVSDAAEGTRRKPDVAMASDGSFVVTWEDDTDGNGGYQVYARRFNADGTAKAKVFTVNSVSDGQQLNPSIGMNEAGTFYIAYEDDADGNDVMRVKARGYDKDGKQIYADTHISEAGEKIADPVVCVASSGNVVYGWYADADAHKDVRRRTYDAAKKTLSSTGRVNYNAQNTSKSPALACTASGKQVFVWADDVDGNSYYEIYGRGYN
ncbi:MAG: metallophosphoesterase [Proteobacteria bacterium]|nr:metallophosphoesterase [Pseudomonadota bacterium]